MLNHSSPSLNGGGDMLSMDIGHCKTPPSNIHYIFCLVLKLNKVYTIFFCLFGFFFSYLFVLMVIMHARIVKLHHIEKTMKKKRSSKNKTHSI